VERTISSSKEIIHSSEREKTISSIVCSIMKRIMEQEKILLMFSIDYVSYEDDQEM
jgi:hypothetical protein